MSDDDLISAVAEYYTQRVVEHGATPRGVDWNDWTSQRVRFEVLLAVLGTDTHGFSINDYGCGYGALLDVLDARYDDFGYRGFDVSAPMIAEARRRYAGDHRAAFTTDAGAFGSADFTVASGIFNVKLDLQPARWERYVLETIDHLAAISTKGFAFNALSCHADAGHTRGDLHYADPGALLDHCLRTHSRTVTLHHDYRLYEFTVVVRLDGCPPATHTPPGEAP